MIEIRVLACNMPTHFILIKRGVNMDNTKTLETERLILRKFTLEDTSGMFNNWATDSQTNKFLSWPLHKSVDETKEIISKWISNY